MANPWDTLTRDEARALITEHKIVGLERDERYRDYDPEHAQLFRLGNGRLLVREDTTECYGEEWLLMHDVIDGTATDAPLRLTAG